MNPVRGLLRRQSLRVRITLTYAGTAAVLAIVLSAGTFISVQRALLDQRVTSTTRQTIFALLFARSFAGTDAERNQRVVSLLQTRAGLDAMVTDGDTWFSSSLSLTPESVPGELRALVSRGRLAYQFASAGGEHVIVYGAPLPASGVNLYLLFSMTDLDRALSLLGRVLVVASAIVVFVAALLAQRISRRVLQPLTAVSLAARDLANGLLEARVVPVSKDELGTLAGSFNEMAGELQRMIERERRFVANASHELRTPLATLEATSGLLAAHRDELSGPAGEAVDLVVEDVAGLRRLIEELLEVSELDAGRATVRWEEVRLRALAGAALERRHREAPIDGEEVTTFSDKARLDRIVGNLLDNAFTHGGGREVRVTVAADDGRCGVSVSDGGPGIPTQEIPKLFDRFFKSDRARTRHAGSVGLGLAIAQQNAALLGGSIEVRTAEGEGSTFSLWIPWREAPPDASEEADAS
jgi:signal transduction histidine kinase